MTALFWKLLDMSISASWLVLAVLAARLVLKKAPKSIRCVLWALVAVRLLCPFSFESEWSLIPETSPALPAEVTAAVSDPAPGEIVYAYSAPAGKERAEAESEIYFAVPNGGGTRIVGPVEGGSAGFWLRTGGIIWAAGMAVMLAYALWSYRRIHKKVAASIDIGKGVHICDYIDSPFILGIVKPKIYLPSALKPDDAAYVLAHERAHLKRRDHWWKPLGFVLLSIYWFNPIIWLAYILLCRDIELACDERVIREMGPADKKAYSEALLSCSVPRHLIAACPLAFGEVGVKERVKSVLNYRKPAFWIVVIAVVLCVIVAVCFLTDPAVHTLTDFQKLDESEITGIEILAERGSISLDSGEEYNLILTVLENTEYDPDPISQERREETEDEYYYWYPYIKITCGDSSFLYYFSLDYSEVWCNDGVKPTYPYRVKNPEALRAYVKAYVTPVGIHTAAGEPFATAEEPWKWMQNISQEVVRDARIFYNQTGRDGEVSRISTICFEQLQDILRGIPQDAISTEGLTNVDFPYMRYGTDATEDTLLLTFAIADNANDLTVLLRIYNEAAQLVLLEGAASLRDIDLDQTAAVWRIEGGELPDLARSLADKLPVLVSWTGSLYDTERIPAAVSHGSAAISTAKLTDWDYEVVEYTEGVESFGIRCRPKAVDEGWLYFSFWPSGYAPVEEDRFYVECSMSGLGGYFSYPDDVAFPGGFNTRGYAWSYVRCCSNIGDYVVINEGADAWFPKYQDLIDIHTVLASFSGGEPVEVTIPESDTGSLTYSQCDNPIAGPHNIWFLFHETEGRGYVNIPAGWMCDVEKRSVDGHPVMFSFWPEGQETGRISLEYWDGFFISDEELTVSDFQIPTPTASYDGFTGTYEGDERWTYLWIDGSSGSYVFRCEQTEDWSDRMIASAVSLIGCIDFSEFP